MTPLPVWNHWGSAVNDQLIHKIAAGDRQAFHTLYEETAKNIYGFALSITRSPHDAEDVVQETMLSVYRNAGGYQGQRKPMAWIFTIAKNAAISHLRKNQNENSMIPIDELWDVAGGGLAELENAELRLTLQTVLNKLPAQEQQIVILHAVHGMKNREIAEILNIPLNTVLSKYHRAIKKMKKIMEENGDES